ncbi:NAD(P)/FAD-dependent oxidoreductase [Haloarchaeobius sp. TZWWS8]|uniref:NAD(P)/FAD-dependent oxidoreductase n=1 Tax=Haloarchaeobius sp. TZWWS8 TaxID=3446121 RepID=UPI003EBBC651
MDPIVIVGGGITGASLAYHLRDHGRPVVLYESDALGSGTSADSVALFVWHQSTPDRTSHRLRSRSWEHYEPLVQDGTLSFEQIGTLDVARTDDEVDSLRALTRTLESFGTEARFLESETLAEYGLDPDAVAGAMATPEDGYLDPYEIIQYYIGEATAAGVTVETQTPVTDIRTSDGRVTGVETALGTQSAAAVVNAAGPWAPAVDEKAGVSHPFRHNRGPVVVLQKDEAFTLPFIQFGDGIYFRGEGQTQAFAGNFGASYEEAELLDPRGARSIPHEFYLEIDDRIQAAVPRLDGVELANEWVGVRTLTPDGVPIVGETAVDDFFVAAGMNGLGVTLAPALGEYLAGVIEGKDVDRELEAYLSPARFS